MMETWESIAAICGALVTLGGAAAVIAKWTKPIRDHLNREKEQDERLKKLEENGEIVTAAIKEIKEGAKKRDEEIGKILGHEKRDLERFDEVASEMKDMRGANQAVYKALTSMMNHMIDGNGIEKLKEARDKLNNFIIDHN